MQLTLGQLALREIRHRPLGFLLAVISVGSACGVLMGSLALSRSARYRIERVLAERQAEFERKLNAYDDELQTALTRLGFDIVILPREQDLADFYMESYAAKTMPEAFARRLGESSLLTIRDVVPVLRRRIDWRERQWTVMLVGVGEPLAGRPPPAALELPVMPPGSVALGWELHRSLGVAEGDRLSILGREFVVERCLPEKGTKEDIAIWADLVDVQNLLRLEGRINEILALGCRWQADWGGRIREEISGILPDVQVVERNSEVLTRALAREAMEKDGKQALLEERRHLEQGFARQRRLQRTALCVVLAVAGPWLILLTFANTRERRGEIGILQALGMSPVGVWFLLQLRALSIALCGAILAIPAGVVLHRGPFSALLLSSWGLLSTTLALILMGTASFFATGFVLRQDPADVLRTSV